MVKVKWELCEEDDCKASIDRISLLPIEVLGFILYFLPFKQAVATSLLRKRWRYLWNLIDVSSIDWTHYIFSYKSENFSSNLRVLKKLNLKSVNVSGEDIGFLLGNCPLLEELFVSVSKALRSLEIIGTFPSFKCLGIYVCPNFNSFVVRDSGVKCTKYYGGRVLDRFLLSNVPLLTHLWIFAILPNRIKGILGMFRSVLPQLHMHKIYVPMRLSIDWRWRYIFPGVEMGSLKLLVVSLGKSYYDMIDPLPMSELIRASHCLQLLVIE
ncbi:hypothetical protein OROMI_002095 [Orobanche minor]